MEFDNYKEFLNDELSKRKSINPSYSLRAFAASLKLDHSRLSQVLQGKKGLSVKAGLELSKILGLNKKEKEWFISSIGSAHARKLKDKKMHATNFEKFKKSSSSYSSLDLEYFKVVSDWYHFAILELTYLDDFNSDPKWIAKKLSIEKTVVDEAILRLKKLELITEINGQLKDSFFNLETPTDISSRSLRKYNAQLINKALAAIIEKPIDEREITSTIFAIDKNNLTLFKEKIRTFKNDICLTNNNADSVYALNIQFFELTNKENL